MSPWQNHEAWEQAGSLTAEARATTVWQAALERYAQPPLDPAVRERLDRYVAARKVVLRDVEL